VNDVARSGMLRERFEDASLFQRGAAEPACTLMSRQVV